MKSPSFCKTGRVHCWSSPPTSAYRVRWWRRQETGRRQAGDRQETGRRQSNEVQQSTHLDFFFPPLPILFLPFPSPFPPFSLPFPSLFLPFPPDISIQPQGTFNKSGQLEFDQVICGHQKVKYIQLKNLAPVPTSWARVKPTTTGGKDGKDDGYYVLEPNQGVLPPKSACNVKVLFAPTAERVYQARISLKCQR